MPCTINLRSDLLQNAQPGGTWTYNGGILIEGSANPYDGNPDNITQFTTSTDTINRPDEFFSLSTAGDDPSVNGEGHSVAYYSLTYTVTNGTCTTTNNVVLPIIEGVCFPVLKRTYTTNHTYYICPTLSKTFDLYEIANYFYNTTSGYAGYGFFPECTGYEDKGTWQQISGTPNPHPGFVIDSNDPKKATFNTGAINYPSDNTPITFRYTAKVNPLSGYTVTNCATCEEKHVDVTFKISNGYECCNDLWNYYLMSLDTASGLTVYDILFTDGVKLSETLFYSGPYPLNTRAVDVLNATLSYNINNQRTDVLTLLQYSVAEYIGTNIIWHVIGYCHGPAQFWTSPDGSTYITPTVTTIF